MDERGFTLLEITITMAVLSLVFLLVFSLPTKATDHLTMEQTIYQIANDIIYAKEYAKTHTVTLGFTISTRDSYYVINRGNKEILKGYIPKEYTISTGFARNEFYINNSGGVNLFGSITLTDKDGKQIWLTTTITSGRVKVYLNE
ncbi:prepilin-type N-terminal cleavage/methylation domain-containing protein [Alkalicella caledoniensis]|uniref:Prepilin-type N-terminal cleavage/methylation domain-containing protein n=1 Tax=Alkalicella caledoniensis TaxID=2731377 RepID=A0A7G9WBN2_ALKCA|nr:prepilin-type N-terminal cleavage/methylation domain-containing protein [Alkalicella caledoniensis]QNO16094.1 prepilin-type N-terminal cleavage/methylation domain-containing protein [Alkalicella caledoniensis]